MAEADVREDPGTLCPKRAVVFASVLALIHLGLALWFATITPYRTSGVLLSYAHTPAQDIGAPDERQHVNYVKKLLDGEGFQVLNPKDPNLYEDYQSHQPPLFYILEVAWCHLTGVADPTDRDQGVRLRYLNGLLGAAEVMAVFFLGAWGFRRPEVGLLSCALAALLPMNVALSGAVSNDVLLFLLCTSTVALSARSIQRGWSVKSALGVGVLVGLAILTKTTALALVPTVLCAALMAGEGKPNPAAWAAAIVPILLLTTPWLLRNLHLYGDPFAMKAFNDSFVGSSQAHAFIDDPNIGLVGYLSGMVLWWTARSFFGAFGWMDIWLNETGRASSPTPNLIYRLLLAGAFVVFLGWLMSWRALSDRKDRAVHALNIVFLTLVVLLFLSFNMHYFQAQARYLLPAIGAIACGFGWGTLTLFKGRWLPALAALVLVFGGLSVYAGMRLPDEFAKRSLLGYSDPASGTLLGCESSSPTMTELGHPA